MTTKPITTNVKPQMLIKSTLHKTKKFFNKSFTHFQSLIPTNRYEKHPKNPTHSMHSKLQELDGFVEEVKKKACDISLSVEGKRDEQRCSLSSITNSDCSGLEDLKEEGKARKRSGRKQEEMSTPVAAYLLAQKMKDLEMMDLNDMDHAMDVEEVLHYYSRLNCQAYVEIVDKFFMDMYLEFHVPKPSESLNNSMRKLESQSLHSSMRNLGPLKL